MNIGNVTVKVTASREFIITDITPVRLDLIVNTVNVPLKIAVFRKLIVTETALV